MGDAMRKQWNRARFALLLGLAVGACQAAPGARFAQADRYPAEEWMRYTNVEDAGFDPVKLEAARVTWEGLPSSAFLIIADGAVVASWGDVERRFMCHSVRKSFLSALYGVHVAEGNISLDQTLESVGIDDAPPLLASEKEARIIDLLKSRSGVYRPAAYETSKMKERRPRRGLRPTRFRSPSKRPRRR